jgi:hypothetical protein
MRLGDAGVDRQRYEHGVELGYAVGLSAFGRFPDGTGGPRRL